MVATSRLYIPKALGGGSCKAIRLSSIRFGQHLIPKSFPTRRTSTSLCAKQKQIEDNPDKGCAITVYFFVLAMWTLMKLAHDWALLADVAEDFTLVIGVLSWAFQLLASDAALYWAAAVTDVFVSRVPEGNGACYYQLQPFATLTALGAALLLLYFSHVKMNNLVLSLVNYYCNIFNMPYGAVKGIAASQPLLTKGLHGDSMFYLHLHHISSLNVETGSGCAFSSEVFIGFVCCRMGG